MQASENPPVVAEHAIWAVVLIARQHRLDDEKESGAWTCPCRCCDWARYEFAEVRQSDASEEVLHGGLPAGLGQLPRR